MNGEVACTIAGFKVIQRKPGKAFTRAHVEKADAFRGEAEGVENIFKAKLVL
jgi:hypothetical protein